jgi:DNA mismatch repair protein MutS2
LIGGSLPWFITSRGCRVYILELPVASLSEIPGIGGRTSARLEEYFGGSGEALRAIAGCRVSLLAEAVGKATAHRIIHGVYRLVYGRWPRSIAYTDEAWQLFTEARSILEEYTATGPGRDVLSCMLPTPTPLKAFARRLFQRVANIVPRLQRFVAVIDSLGRLLQWPRPVHLGRLQRLLVVVGDKVAYREAERRLAGVVRLAYVEDSSEVSEVAHGEEDVVVYDPYGIYEGPLPRAADLTVEEVAPEAIVEFFRANWKPLTAVAKAVEAIGAEEFASLAAMLGKEISVKALQRIVKLSELLAEGKIAEGIDPELDRLRRAVERLEAEIDDAEAWLNDMLRSELEKLEVRVPARKLLELLSSLRRGEPPPPLELPEELLEAYMKLSRTALERLAERLALSPDEKRLIEDLIPPYPSYPVEFDRSRLDDLRATFMLKLSERRLNVLRMIASLAKGVREAFEDSVQLLALLDAGLSMLRLRSSGAPVSLAKCEEGGVGVAFHDAVEASLLLESLRGRMKVQPVSYVVGNVDAWERVTHGEKIVLLTGANSGGKTTLLKTIAETVLLAHAGLPVYAEKAYVSAFDTVIFISKPSGEVGAGALETLLQNLAQIATMPGRKLVLVDELEAATEAGAASKLLAGFIEQLLEQRNTVAVIVSHLADSIISSLNPKARKMVRVDGIEAVGLDENYNLIVDRNPRYYYHAKSTPELVVSKLLAKARSSSEKSFYSKLLEKLSSQ